MNKEQENRINSSEDALQRKLFEGGSFVWQTSREEIWTKLEPGLNVSVRPKTVRFRPLMVLVSSAAAVILLLSLTIFARFYSENITNPAGKHLTVQLPDGSSILLNAESALSYHPWWWHIKREVYFMGEGFFEVKPGKKFSVRSTMGTTSVLGTSFNIFAREKAYRVTCVTGSVRVTSNLKNSVVLLPETKAEIDENGQIRMISLKEPSVELGWKNYLFFFTATPINEVLREIERQYGVKLKNNAVPLNLYTGNFKKEEMVEEVLKVVCLPMGLNFKKISESEYLIYQSN